MQGLKELIQQLQAENDRLRGEQASVQPHTSSRTAPVHNVAATERLLYVPRERKCPVFRGSSGIGIEEWLEEVKASARARHLGELHGADFMYDHLEGEAKDEI